jgi:hypothetical protein
MPSLFVYASDRVRVPRIEKRPYTVLRIKRYDGAMAYEVVKTKEVGIRAKEIWSEYPIWEEAHRRARIQWAKWFWEKTPANAGREWVLPKPDPPKFRTIGRYEDVFEAEERAKKLQSAHNSKLQRIKRLLRRRARRSRKSLAYLDNLEENRKLVRALIPRVHVAMLARDRRVVRSLPNHRKKRIWALGHVARQRAERELKEDAMDGKGDESEPDAVDLYNAVQEAMRPILAHYDVTERQWYMIWEEGYISRWPVPDIEEESDRISEQWEVEKRINEALGTGDEDEEAASEKDDDEEG